MAVHHHQREILDRGQEGFSDPQEIERILVVECHPGANAGMHEEIIAGDEAQRTGAQEAEMRGGQVGDDFGQRRMRRDAIAAERRRPAILKPEFQPLARRFGRAKVEHHRFMIAQ